MHLYLIGYRGSGKSTVGRLLAVTLQRPFVDTDESIEACSGLTIREIFQREGESGFREREERVIADVAKQKEFSVVALGGGAVLRTTNRHCIRQSGKCVWLQGSAEELFSRIQTDATTAERRPNLSAGGGYAEVVELLAAREPVYAELADLTIETAGRLPDEIAAEIAAWVNTNEKET